MTRLERLSVVEREAIMRAARGFYQEDLLDGLEPWGGCNAGKLRSQDGLLARLRAVRGLRVVEKNNVVAITGSLDPDGFARRI